MQASNQLLDSQTSQANNNDSSGSNANTNRNNITFVELELEIDSLVIGERIKGGTFRPCIETIPSTTIEGALREYFGIDVHAVGRLDEDTYEIDEIVYAVTDRYLATSKVPITTQYLKPKNGKKIKATIYIPTSSLNGRDMITKRLKGSRFMLGALKSKGFGRSKITSTKECTYNIRQGVLAVRLLKDECPSFGIEIIAARYGYLFKQDTNGKGVYKISLFEGSIVKAPYILLKRVIDHDNQ
ncbi:MAG: hypothetical protein QXJ44_08055 [Candidatus Nitrosocaldus sp.]